MLETFILPAISFALSATMLPGPMQAYIVNTTLQHGWRKGIAIVFSPLLTDIPIIIVVVFLLGQLPPVFLQGIRLFGGLFLLFIAWGAWRQYQKGIRIETDANKPSSGHFGKILLTAVLMNWFSPGPYLFWTAINGPLLLQALDESPVHAVAFLVAFYGTFIIGLSSLVFLFHAMRRVNETTLGYIILLTIGLLVVFGTALIFDALGLSHLHPPLIVMFAVLTLIRWQIRRVQPA